MLSKAVPLQQEASRDPCGFLDPGPARPVGVQAPHPARWVLARNAGLPRASGLGAFTAFSILRRALPRPSRPSAIVPLLLALVAIAPAAFAQSSGAPEHASLRLRYGLSLRQGQQSDVGPGLTYDGMTPNDVSAQATGWVGSWLGAWASVQREAFDLKAEGTRVTGGSLWRASVGPRVRALLGPVRLEVGAGYGYSQLPLFAGAESPELARGIRHAALVGGRVLVPLPAGLRLEGRGEVPLTLSASDASGAKATASGYAVGGALLVPLKRARGWAGTLVLDFQQVRDTVTLAEVTRSEQRLRRVGAALEFTWEADSPAREASAEPVLDARGALALRVVDAATGAPLAGARVTLVVGGEAREPVAADAEGRVDATELPVGEVLARVQVEGHEEAEARAQVVAGGRAELEVRAQKPAPVMGSLRVTVVDAATGAPLPEARVAVGTVKARADVSGKANIEGLAPGPVAVAVVVPGFRPVEDAAVIVAGQQAELAVALSVERKTGELATLTGQVRSTRGGRPLVATLAIPQARVRTRADKTGAFSVRVRGGTYRIIISAPGHRPQSKSVMLRDGERAIFNVDLLPRAR
ncbi:carboxypeptidase regulatory-like domain-containing protein [Myxococcaceae bacterium JPH2]|nr:carboxypeptidase regulatory-like domain-containing protein [Myxococcaceae bacterium JPH2]